MTMIRSILCVVAIYSAIMAVQAWHAGLTSTTSSLNAALYMD